MIQKMMTDAEKRVSAVMRFEKGLRFCYGCRPYLPHRARSSHEPRRLA